MLKKIPIFYNIILALLLFSAHAYAWQHELSFGLGYGNEVEQSYKNSGAVLWAKFYKFPKLDERLIATLDGSVAYFHAATRTHQQLVTAALTASFRGYFYDPDPCFVRPYIGTSIGPALLSAKRFGTRIQGSHAALQISLESGVETGQFDFNLKLIHYCNAGIVRPNDAINIFPVFSIGYLF